ncbi:hypothetical protein BDF22DRAFT_668035 [Syncephalis plumigaleata]|nr:hypothetical protein BDF22DRAFT_668035 [Syncephalis plumigaleata]
MVTLLLASATFSKGMNVPGIFQFSQIGQSQRYDQTSNDKGLFFGYPYGTSGAFDIPGLTLKHIRSNGFNMVDAILNHEEVMVLCDNGSFADGNPYRGIFNVCRRYENDLADKIVKRAGCPQHIKHIQRVQDINNDQPVQAIEDIQREYTCFVSQGINPRKPHLFKDIKVNAKTAKHTRETIVTQLKEVNKFLNSHGYCINIFIGDAIIYETDGTIKHINPVFHKRINDYNRYSAIDRNMYIKKYLYSLFEKYRLDGDNIHELVEEASQDLLIPETLQERHS